MAENNSEMTKLKRIVDAPGKPIQQWNCYRMSYDDLNYLESIKAIFYFDRGIRGKQTFNNSTYSLEQQPKFKDIIVIGDIVVKSGDKWKQIIFGLNENLLYKIQLITNTIGLLRVQYRCYAFTCRLLFFSCSLVLFYSCFVNWLQ